MNNTEQMDAGKWYDRKLVVWLLLIFFFPVGYYALYKSRGFTHRGKWMSGLAVAVLIVLGLAMDEPPEPIAEVSVAEKSTPQKLPEFSITSDEVMPRIKRSVEVLLPERVSEEQLYLLAHHIRGLDSRSYDRTFIGYRIKGQAGGMYWATTHFDPGLQVVILGETAEQYEVLIDRYEGPRKFVSVADMIESFGDFSEANNTFSQNEGSFRLSPLVLGGDHADVIQHLTLRAAAYGVFNAFIHTDVPSVALEVRPLMTDNMRGDNPRLLDYPALQITVSRDQALRVAKRFFPVDALEDMKVPTRYGEDWLEEFDSVYSSHNRVHDLDLLISLLQGRP